MLSVLFWVSAASLSRPSRSRISGLARAQPSRSPGARILEKLPRCRTRPSVSRLFSVGRSARPRSAAPGMACPRRPAARSALASSISRRRRQAERDPGRVLEVRDGVEHGRVRVGRQHLLEVVGVHPVRVGPDRRVRGLRGGERDQRPEERRVLGDDHVAGVDHQLGGQVEPLLAALDDQHVVGGCRPCRPGSAARRPGPGAAAGRWRRCTAGRRRVPGRAAARTPSELVDREEGRIGVAAAEGDDLGVGAEPQQLADGRRPHAIHPIPPGVRDDRTVGCHEKASRLSSPASRAARCSS